MNVQDILAILNAASRDAKVLIEIPTTDHEGKEDTLNVECVAVEIKPQGRGRYDEASITLR